MTTPTGSRTAPHDLMELLVAEQQQHDANALVERAAALHDDHLLDLPAFLAPVFRDRVMVLALVRFAHSVSPHVTADQIAAYEEQCREADASRARDEAGTPTMLDAVTDALARAGFAASADE